MDPIRNGNDIFIQVLSKYPEQIKDNTEAEKLIDELIQKTGGLLIVDFIGLGGWDHLGAVKLNSQTGHLSLIERVEDANHNPIGFSSVNPDTRYCSGIIMHFKDLIKVESKGLSGVFLRGYATKEKHIKKLYSKDAVAFEFSEHDKKHFRASFTRTYRGVEEDFEFHNTPIYSLVILPKNTELGYSDTQQLLFKVNFGASLIKLQERKSQLEQIDFEDEDSICEKVNTGRRVFEFVLKVECCLIQDMNFLFEYIVENSTEFPKDYNDLLLGDLVKLVKPFIPNSSDINLNRIVRETNKLSHDSGQPVSLADALELFELLIDYTKKLYDLVIDREGLTSYYSENFEKRKYDHSRLKPTNFNKFDIS